MDNTAKFSGRAEIYTKARPSYSPLLFEHLATLKQLDKGCSIADIGSGTGILSQQLLEKGCSVYCVEPNDDMRKTAEKLLSHYNSFISVNGTAENTGLVANTADIITVAQAFHWFDAERFKAECKRILKQDGIVALIWNSRDNNSELIKENAQVCRQYCPNFKGFSGGIENIDERINNFFDGKYEYVSYPNNLIFDEDKFINRMLSGSYSLKQGEPEYDNYINALKKLFKKHSQNNIMNMPNNTVAYIGRL